MGACAALVLLSVPATSSATPGDSGTAATKSSQRDSSTTRAPQPGAYGENDAGGFRNVLPPGQGQTVNVAEVGAFVGLGTRPEHDQDQLGMYDSLVQGAPGLRGTADVATYFKDATFGVTPADVARTYSPRDDVTIVRDESFGVPHVYGEGRAGAMFGIGYASAEDRLFLMDALRHAGRAELSSFAGGGEGNLEFDHSQWPVAPYAGEAEYQLQFDRGDELFGPEGVQIQQDVTNYVAGINQYIAEARVNPLLLPGEYPLLGMPEGPEDWKVTDVIATASLVAGIFGKGGGGEVGSALVLEAARKRFGKRGGKRVWADFRSAEDSETPTTVERKRFRYRNPPRKVRGLALPDPGTVEREPLIVASSGSGGSVRTDAERDAVPDIGDLLRPLRFTDTSSNALLVSERESETGNPIAVMGPQVSYFTPQILIEQDVHAPAGPEGPALDARGTAFPGTNLYVQLGHGRNYAWSATSAGQDIIDTFAVKLCEPDGSRPTLESMSYRDQGECRRFEVLDRVNSWTPSLGDDTPAGSQTLRALRSEVGLVTHRAMVNGKPHAYTQLRATYFHEVDSAAGFARFNNPEAMATPQRFIETTSLIEYTFNWLYVNQDRIAFFNSGANPKRDRGASPHFPVKATREWKRFDPETLTSARFPASKHPQVVDPRFITSWNNKQAPGYRAADDGFSYQSVHRVLALNDRLRRLIWGKRKASLAELVQVMADAGTVDVRGAYVLPHALKVLGKAGKSPRLRDAVSTLRAWLRSGAHRRDLDLDGHYEDTEAIRIFDAWYPRLIAAQFRPVLGKKLFEAIQGMISIKTGPDEDIGNAWGGGWFGYAEKDLRTVLGKRVKGAYSREYCGRGKLNRCRKALARSLKTALAHTSEAELYPDGPCDEGDAQWCSDSIGHTAVGAVTQPRIQWQNRPTFQQAVEIGG
ncbi:MAG: penicillin acylase family protein [Solirubrobacterales bacterium]